MNIFYMMAYDTVFTPGRFTGEGDGKAHLCRLLSNTDSSLHEYFYTGAFTLEDGRHIAPGESGKAVVSKTLAEANGLGIGESITFTVSEENVPAEDDALGKTYAFEIVGIFDINVPQNIDGNTAECDIAENFVFVDENAAKRFDIDTTGKNREMYRSGAAFFVRDPQNMDGSLERLMDIDGVDGEKFNISVNNKAYKDSITPLNRLGEYTGLLILVITVIGILLLSLIMAMWMRDRVHEIGVYLSIGVKKASIVAQHILEALMVMAAALVIAWPVSGLVSAHVGGYLLDAVPVEGQTTEAGGGKVVFQPDPVDVSQIGKVEELDIRVGAREFLMAGGCFVLVILVSAGVASVVVVRMKPRDILSSMS
jgi:ABC-type antimicrobial peptide transport system permease subunit